MLQSTTIETQAANAERLQPLHPVGAVAASIAMRSGRKDARPILYVAQNSRRAREILTILRVFVGDERAALYPRWDGFAADGVPASVPSVGTRMSVLRWLLDAEKRPAIVVTTAAALMRMVPPRRIWDDVHLEFSVGEAIDIEETKARLARIGYILDERCDVPGEATFHGQVIEFFPAAAPRPARIEHDGRTITAIRPYDPITQRSVGETAHLIVDPASERIQTGDETVGEERSLASFYGTTETVFDYVPDAEVILEADTDRSADAFRASLTEADDDDGDFLGEQEWEVAVSERLAAIVEDEPDGEATAFVPRFALEADPIEALRAFVDPLRAKGYRIVLAGPASDMMRLWARRLERLFDGPLTAVAQWSEVRNGKSADVFRFEVPIQEGFVSHQERIALIALRDLAGHTATGSSETVEEHFGRGDQTFGIGDAIVHFDHGVAILEGLESVGDGEHQDEAIRLRFADDATLLVPMREIGALWRYGGSGTDVSLDKLKGDSWTPKRNKIVGEISRTAERMVEALQRRSAAKAKPIQPERVAFERFCERFAHEPTSGQLQAIDAILGDLRSGRPMDRLLCGDVGFGKTEVALRAVAAAAFAGRQVAIVAPTTVLARQHFELFRHRFAKDDIEVAMLSRLQTPAELREVKAGIADGRVRIVVATHAICRKDVAFKDLALVVIDEEQRFGSRHKNAMRALAPELHVLAMTATPIPRTLQAGFVGLHDVSVISTPPVRRRPIRTRIAPFDNATIADALEAEKARGGRSFVVCPRIEDIAPMEKRLRALVPHLDIVVLHGDMPAVEVERVMIEFSKGVGDILLATNIIESGIDVQEANTIVICRPDRFGLAQLHQLRGRVGRGARRGIAILATEPDAELTHGSQERLATLERLTALGSGFDISARDLDLRGAGELLGDEQAGHLQLIGLSLYRRTLEHALGVACGERVGEDWNCDLNVGIAGTIPATYIAEPELRIELAAALDRAKDETSLTRVRDDTIDRFGSLPAELETSFKLASLRVAATALGVRKLDAGPKALAATFSKADAERLKKRIKPKKGDPLRWSELRLILDEPSDGEERWAAIERFLDELA